MAIRFSADEILEIAERIEENGAKFYRKAEEMFVGTENAGLFEKLAVMEEQHRGTFAKMREDLKGKEVEKPLLDPENLTGKFLSAIADGEVFNIKEDPEGILKGNETFEDVIRLAIAAEKNSIVFYLGMMNMVTEDMGKEKLAHIIQEEQSHIVILVDLIKK